MSFKPSFEMIQRPVGRQNMPYWLLDAHIDWCEEFANSPRLIFKVSEEVGTWPNQVYRKEGAGAYISESNDGRMHRFWHSGSVTRQEIDGVMKRVTTQQDGFGGAKYTLMMDDGEETVLRGPWAGGAPEGFTDAAYVNLNASWRRGRDDRPWWRQTACAGIFFSNEVVIKALARFCPHVELALVKHWKDYPSRIEPLKPEWTAPKGWDQISRSAA